MRKNIKNLLLLFIIISLFGCETQKIKFLTTEDGKKQYKNEDGIFVKDDWVELDGDKYFFDKNGYLVTDEWIQDEYYVDTDGKMKKDYWYNDGKSDDFYYLGDDGKYVKDKIVEIGNKKYAFDKSGLWIKNKIFLVPNEKEKYMLADKNGIVVDKEGEMEIENGKYYISDNGEVIFDEWKMVDGKKAYYDESGKRVYKGFAVLKDKKISTESEIKKWCYLDENGDIVKDQYIDVDEQNYCADKEGILLSNEWKEYEGKKYFYGPDCYLLKNQIVDGVYYVDETGAMVINKDININGKMYTFGSDGKGNVKINTKNSGVLGLTKNGKYRIKTYSNSVQKYIENVEGYQVYETDYIGESKNSFSTGKAYIIADSGSIRFRIRYGSNDEKGNINYVPYIKVSSENNGWEKNRGNIISFSSVIWSDGDKYIQLSFDDAKKLVVAMENNERLYVTIESYYDFIDASRIYKFMIESEGFIELLNSIV